MPSCPQARTPGSAACYGDAELAARYGEGVSAPQQPPKVEVRRSAKRRRTVSARREGDTVVILLPARLSKAEEAQWVAKMLAKLAFRNAKQQRSQQVRLAAGAKSSAAVPAVAGRFGAAVGRSVGTGDAYPLGVLLARGCLHPHQ